MVTAAGLVGLVFGRRKSCARCARARARGSSQPNLSRVEVLEIGWVRALFGDYSGYCVGLDAGDAPYRGLGNMSLLFGGEGSFADPSL